MREIEPRMNGWRKERRKEERKEGRKEGRKEVRKEGGKEGKKKRKEGWKGYLLQTTTPASTQKKSWPSCNEERPVNVSNEPSLAFH